MSNAAVADRYPRLGADLPAHQLPAHPVPLVLSYLDGSFEGFGDRCLRKQWSPDWCVAYHDHETNLYLGSYLDANNGVYKYEDGGQLKKGTRKPCQTHLYL